MPATVYGYFVKYVGWGWTFLSENDNRGSILTVLAFSLEKFTETTMDYGINEVLLASVLGTVVFAVFAA